MNGRLFISTVSVLTALVLGASALAAGRSTARVITGTKTIDGYRVGTTYAQARKVLGGPYSATQSSAVCTARWTNGVTITWRRRLPRTNWTRACLRFSSAKVGRSKTAGPVWRTDKGLRVRASASQVKRLYPAATSKRSGRYTIWTLTKTPTVSLQAWVTRGRVAYFRLVHS